MPGPRRDRAGDHPPRGTVRATPPFLTPPGDGVPAGTRLVIAPTTGRLAPGLVAGGSPWRLLRLSAAGDRWIDRWRVGQVVPEQAGARHLATRLVDTGLAWSRPEPDREISVAVVVPCRDRTPGLAATLAALEPGLDVTVVDDGSTAPEATARAAAARPGTHLVHRCRSGGPATARNDGWRQVAGAGGGGRDQEDPVLIGFLDTECIPPSGWLADLAGHFRDPGVGAVAPRVEAAPTPGAASWLHVYEQLRSPLDLGPIPAPVRPLSSVPYVPSATLVVRRSALVEIDGFDHDLTTGEDVDLVWRLDRAGWRVRYDPSVVVAHPVRPDLRAWLAQRVGYGRSAAPLASRHGSAVAPLSISRWSAAAWSSAALGHPVLGLAVALGASAHLAARPPVPVAGARRRRGDQAGPSGAGPWPRAEIARLAVRGHLRAGLGLAEAVRRTWWPLAVVFGLTCRRIRPALVAVVVVPPLVEWRQLSGDQRRPGLGRARWVALRLADDLAYGAGVWAGVWAERRVGCLRPDLL